MEDIKKRMADFISSMKKRGSITESHAVAQGFADAISHADTRAVEPPKSKPSDILGMGVSSGMDSWRQSVAYAAATRWIDDLIEESKPTIKSLGIPKAKHD